MSSSPPLSLALYSTNNIDMAQPDIDIDLDLILVADEVNKRYQFLVKVVDQAVTHFIKHSAIFHSVLHTIKTEQVC